VPQQAGRDSVFQDPAAVPKSVPRAKPKKGFSKESAAVSEDVLSQDCRGSGSSKMTRRSRVPRRRTRALSLADRGDPHFKSSGSSLADLLKQQPELEDQVKDENEENFAEHMTSEASISVLDENEVDVALEQSCVKPKTCICTGDVNPVSQTGALRECDIQSGLKEHTKFHLHGIMTEGQHPGDERERLAWRTHESMGDGPAVISCQKGMKGINDKTPNQDNFSITYFNNGYSVACCFDGHGKFGHLVATRTVQSVPYLLAKSESFPRDMPVALTEAFERAHEDVVALAMEEGWDIHGSGCTAIAAVWNDMKVWTANAGDSRCVIGSELSGKILSETMDHKPDSGQERARIEQHGGEVRTMCYDDGVKISRIYAKGKDFPGLCMSRSLGDVAVKPFGVVATPEISVYDLDVSERPFLLLASDGVFEFLESHCAANIISRKVQEDGFSKRVHKLHREAQKRWRQEEGDYCDDITTVLVPLQKDASFRYAHEQSDSGLKFCIEKSYADLRARMADYSRQPSAARRKLMEKSCADLQAQMAKLHQKSSSPESG
jgi:serine/threonine protein phosphatase PrpC